MPSSQMTWPQRPLGDAGAAEVPVDHQSGLRPRTPPWLPSARREAPVILTVDAAAMHAAGHAFYQAANGVWLTDHVTPGYLSGWPARAGSRRTRPFHARGSAAHP